MASRQGGALLTQEFLTNRFFAALVICCGAWLAVRYRKSIVARDRSQAALREVHRIAQLGHFELDVERGSPIFCSPECLRILGLDTAAGPSISVFFRRLVHPEDRPALLRSVRAAMRLEGRYDIEFRIVRPDGDIRDVLSSGQFFPNTQGEPISVTGTLFDVSEWRRAERARRNSEARLQSILECAPDALVIVDLDGGIQTFSVSAERLFGFEAREVIGKPFGMLTEPSRGETPMGVTAIGSGFGHAPAGGRHRLCAVRKDGSTFPIEQSVSVARLGRQMHLTVFIRDLTETQRMEEELRQSQKVEAIGQLTGGIAHDFNNILTVIMGNLEMLEARLVRKPLRAMVREARETAELGAQLTDRLLAFGRRRQLDTRRIDLAELLGSFDSLLRLSTGENIELELQLATDLPPVMVDPSQLQIALFNLALNAKYAMSDGGKLTITAAAATRDELLALHADISSSFVAVEVRDTGMGMSEDVRKRALEPFFTTKEAGAGTGLGLPMVHGFLKQSSGHLRIESEPGKGTAIRLYLPSVPGAEPDIVRPAPQGETPPGRGETILVVEDDRHVRRLNVARLKELGYDVIAAASGPEALERLKARADIDLLFSDFVMPGGMNGGDLAKAARRLRPGIATLLTTGYTQPELVRLGRLEGARWLTKPFDLAELARAVRHALDARKPVPRKRRRAQLS